MTEVTAFLISVKQLKQGIDIFVVTAIVRTKITSQAVNVLVQIVLGINVL